MSTLSVDTITDASGGTTASINGYTPTASNMAGKNLVINGGMQISQRGTSFSLGNAYTLDRFVCNTGNTDNIAATITQDSDAPDGFYKSLKFTTTTAESVVDADEYVTIRHRIEANNLQRLKFGTSAAEQITLSFWVKSSVTGTYAVNFYRQDSSRQVTSTYTINAANTWEKKTITLSGDTTGTIPDDNGNGFEIGWALLAGSDWTSSDSTSWGSYSNNGYLYGHAQNGVCTTLNATWQLTGVQLEVGSTATEFEHRLYGQELALCQRYFEKSYIQTDAVGTSSVQGYSASPVASNTVPTNQVYSQICFAATKRTTPTVTFYGFNGSSGQVSNASSGADLGANSGIPNSIGTQGFHGLNYSGGTLATSLYGIIYHWIASAEL